VSAQRPAESLARPIAISRAEAQGRGRMSIRGSAWSGRLVVAGFVLLPFVLGFLSLFLGRYDLQPLDLLKMIAAQVVPIDRTWSEATETVIVRIRLPRILMAAFVGAGLAISGASFQGLFRNPLVSPDILGVTSGAGFGAALAILFSASELQVQMSAVAFGLLSVLLTYALSRVYRSTPTLMLVLSGIVVGSIFSALISLAKYVADPNEVLPAITFWLMGSLSSSSMREVITAVPVMLLGMVGLLSVRWRINVLSLGDEEARALGVKTESFKAAVIVFATITTAAAVSVSGIIGWVGLVMPHVARMLVGPDHRRLLPVSLSLGAAYVILIDDIARSAVAGEIPLGILTAIVGAPFFAYLLRRTKGGGQWSER
jgi:iron complex transport system permease protein